jgi:tetratricopeptide (TPR) repeat protein
VAGAVAGDPQLSARSAGPLRGDMQAAQHRNETVDFFISRRGANAAMAQEVADVLLEADYTVLVQDYDILPGSNFVATMHEALKRCRHLVVLLTKDYDASEFTLMELANFLASAARSGGERRLVVLRVDDCNPEGVFAGVVYGDLVGIADPNERKERILAAAEGRSRASARRPKIFENIPPRDLHFTGREHILTQLHGVLMDSDRPAAIMQAAIHGLGGIGKTSLAAEYAHRFASAYAGAWWARAQERTLLVASLATLAGRLEPRLAEEADHEAAAQAGLSRLARSALPYLLIYDNVEMPDTLRDLVPSAGARVLVTTRWADWGGRATEMKLDLLRPDAAAGFLQKRAGRRDEGGAVRLAEALGFLPLALDHAGAYCRLTATSFDAYREKIDGRIARAPMGVSYPASIAATFGLAIEKAAAEYAAAETLLGFLAFLAPERIPLSLVTSDIVDDDARADALMVLAAVSLVEITQLADGSPAVSVHRLVQAATRARLALHERVEATLEQVTRRLMEAFPEGSYRDPKLWPECSVLLPHVLSVRDHAGSSCQSAATATLFAEAGNYLVGRGAYQDAEPLLREAVRLGEKALGPEHLRFVRSLSYLADLLRDTGRYEEAEPFLRRAIASGEQILGREDPRVARWLNDLANLLRDARRFDEAEPLYREAISIGERILGREHPRVANTLHNLALLYANTSRPDEAELLYREAIAIGDRTSGRENPMIATWIDNLANLLRDVGRPDEAEPLYRSAIDIFLKTIGEEHSRTARGYRNFAAFLMMTGRSQEAVQYAELAFSVHERVHGVQHAWTRKSAGVLADVLVALARPDEATALRARCSSPPKS